MQAKRKTDFDSPNMSKPELTNHKGLSTKVYIGLAQVIKGNYISQDVKSNKTTNSAL